MPTHIARKQVLLPLHHYTTVTSSLKKSTEAFDNATVYFSLWGKYVFWLYHLINQDVMYWEAPSKTSFSYFTFPDLAFGSVVSIKNHRAGGALLHSHSHLYPKEHPPEQQQVRTPLCFRSLFPPVWFYLLLKHPKYTWATLPCRHNKLVDYSHFKFCTRGRYSSGMNLSKQC